MSFTLLKSSIVLDVVACSLASGLCGEIGEVGVDSVVSVVGDDGSIRAELMSNRLMVVRDESNEKPARE